MLALGAPPVDSDMYLGTTGPVRGQFEREREAHSGSAHVLTHIETTHPESAVRNWNDTIETMDRFPSLFLDDDGRRKPHLFILGDGGHGPNELMFRFAMGVVFLLGDFSVIHVVTNAGGQSKFNVVEQLNGSFSKRLNGRPLRVDAIEWANASVIEREALMRKLQEYYTSIANGARFVRDHVAVAREEGATVWCAEGPAIYKLNEPEMLRFLIGGTIERETEICGGRPGWHIGVTGCFGLQCSVGHDARRRSYSPALFQAHKVHGNLPQASY